MIITREQFENNLVFLEDYLARRKIIYIMENHDITQQYEHTEILKLLKLNNFLCLYFVSLFQISRNDITIQETIQKLSSYDQTETTSE